MKFKFTFLLTLTLMGLIFLSQQSAAAEPNDGQTVDVYQNATFTVKFRTAADPGDCPTPDGMVGELQSWPAEAQGAMNHVVDILDNLVNSDVPIVIDACYQPDSTEGSLAFASATESFNGEAGGRTVTYAAALANAIDGIDNNGDRSEILTSVNSNISWDYCSTNCTVADDKFDFVSTLVHEILHGMGFAMTFSVDDEESPSTGSYTPDITDTFVYTFDGTNEVTKLIDIENGSAELLDAFLGGSGTVVFAGPHTKAANDGNSAFVYSTTTWESGSSMSHLDDNHVTNLGRMMNAATGEGPSSRTVDAITLAFMKDIGWSVNDAQDFSDGTSYPAASHIASSGMVNHIRFGDTVSTESSPAAADGSDDGIRKIGTWSIGPLGGMIEYNIQGNAGAKGCLNGWADWNQDNDFADAGEQIFDMVPVSAGFFMNSFEIPGSVDPETPHQYRFRLHQDWDNDGMCDDQVGVSSTVRLMNGEVEDYTFPVSTVDPGDLDEQIYLPYVVK